ncbi:MAG: FMN-binding protein [Bacilli bacterium]|nr:FMN-binding protein [Bacilli bacterium]MBN2876365.1 FMN-binding protein [Bacilli bacterium]
MSGGIKSGLVLLVLGIISGLLLASVNAWTDPYIKEIELQEQYDALKEFYFDPTDPNYATYQVSDLYDLTKLDVNEGSISTILVLKDKTSGTLESLAYVASGNGYNGAVTMLIVVDSDLTVRGYKILTQNENPPIQEDFINYDYNVSAITDLSQFDAIAHATFTSNAVLACFNAVSERAANDFGGGLNE